MPTQTVSITWAQGSEQVTQAVALTADTNKGGDYPIAAGAVNTEIDIAFLVAGIKIFLAVCDQALTLKTNSSGTPQETINLAANTPFLWFTGSGFAVPFAGNVTKFFASNPGGAIATLNLRILEDATP